MATWNEDETISFEHDGGVNEMASVLGMLQANDAQLGHFGNDVISNEGIRRLLWLAFNVSLRPDEGRFPRFRIHVIQKHRSPRFTARFNPLVKLIDEAVLRRLAPLVPTFDHALVVREVDGVLCAEGVVHNSSDSHDIGRPKLWSGGGWDGIPIRIEAPGELRFPIGPDSLFRLQGNNLSELETYAFDESVKQWFQKLADLLWAPSSIPHEIVAEESFRWASGLMNLLRDIWSRVLTQTINRRHGGAFIICRNHSKLIEDLTEVDDLGLGTEAIQHWKKCCDVIGRLEEPRLFGPVLNWRISRGRLIAAADTISGFANLDGCVVLDERLTVKGFGGKIQADSLVDRDVQVVDWKTGEDCSEAFSRGHGTRHRSACNFLKSVPEAWAYIVPQDGGLTIMRAEHEHRRVAVWRGVGAWLGFVSTQ